MNKMVVPELGEGIEKAIVACWHVKSGDFVNHDDDIVEMVTDKASFQVSAPISGVVKKIMVKEGQEVKIGDVLAIIEPDSL